MAVISNGELFNQWAPYATTVATAAPFAARQRLHPQNSGGRYRSWRPPDALAGISVGTGGVQATQQCTFQLGVERSNSSALSRNLIQTSVVSG